MSLPPPTEKQARVIWFALTAISVSLLLALIGAVLWGLGQVVVALSPVLWPIAVAGVIAFILDPVVEWLSRRGVPRLRAILLVFAVAFFVVVGVLGNILPRALTEASDLARRAKTEYQVNLKKRVQNWINHPPAPLRDLLGSVFPGSTNTAVADTNATVAPVTPADATIGGTNGAIVVSTNDPVVAPAEPGAWWTKALDPAALKTAGDWASTVLPEVGRWFVGQLGRVASWFGILAGLALIPIYAFYFLLEKHSIERHWTSYLPLTDSRFKDEAVWLLRNINDALIVFFRGQVLVALCDGVMYTIGFLLIGLPYALLLGMVATVLTIVPFLGAIVTCVSALLIALVQFGDWQHPLLVLVVFVVVQGIEGWIVQPKIIGDRVGLHPVTIIIALLVGTTLLGGLLGGLLAIPATAVLRALMFRYIWRVSS